MGDYSFSETWFSLYFLVSNGKIEQVDATRQGPHWLAEFADDISKLRRLWTVTSGEGQTYTL
jgi:hypothetical protein